ncbi:MAG: glycosyltransferase [Planctomycetota bacterium]|nr:MAG: glycosyltransferase [Planctomycetota bacterium]
MPTLSGPPTAPRLLHCFPTFAAGGAQVRALQLIAALGARHVHAVVALDGVTSARELLEPGAALRIVEAPPRAGTLASLRAYRALLRRERPARVLTYNWGAIEMALAARSLGLPVLHHEDGFRPDEVRAQKARRVWTRRLVLRRAELVVPSRTLERIALATWRLARERVHYVANGIRCERFGPPDRNLELRARFGWSAEHFVVGTVAHLRGEKNLLRLLGAFAHLPRDARLLVLGDGPERAALEARARAADLCDRVAFAGHQLELPPWYRAFDAFALSSDTEQMPLSLLEAMATGVACASTDVGDVRAMLPAEQHAFVVPAQAGAAGERALGEALARLCADAALCARLGAANRARVAREHSFDAMVRAHARLWDPSATIPGWPTPLA